MFKFILKEASPQALVQWINGLFGKNFPVESPVLFETTENVAKQDEKFEKIQSDMILTIGSGADKAAFHLEVQIEDDETMALQVFQYGFAYAKQHKTISKDKRVITMTMPDARIIFWESIGTTPDRVTLRLLFPDGSSHNYDVETFKMLDQRLETLEKRNMALLLPFYLLKFRKLVSKPGVTSGERRELADQERVLLKSLEAMLDRSRRQGILNNEDAAMVMEHIAQMHDELYKTYPEFTEVRMELADRVKTHWKEYLVKGEQKAKNQIRELLKQGYTAEQLATWLDNDSCKQGAPSTR